MTSPVRKIFLGLTFALAVFPSLVFSATTQTTLTSNKVLGPTNGLIGYWTMNGQDINWTTGTVLDRSGQGNNGLMVGMATKTAPVGGKLGQALNFDGTDDYVRVLQNGNFNLSASSFSIAMWVRDDTLHAVVAGTFHRFISWYDGSKNIQLGLAGANSPANTRQYYVLNDNVSAAPKRVTNIAGGVKLGLHHLVATSDGTNYLLYVDGIASGGGTTALTAGVFTNNSTTLYIGQRGDNSSAAMTKGILDDVRIYNRTLSASEVTQLYNVGQVKLATPQVQQRTSTSGLVGWWTFDGPDVIWTTDRVLDKSGNGNTGVITNMAMKTAPVGGRLGQAFIFDGVNNYVNMGNVLNFTTGDFSLSAWVKSPNQNWVGALLSKRDGSSPYKQYAVGQGTTIAGGTSAASKKVYFFTHNGGTVGVGNNSQSYYTTNDVFDGNWHHVVGLRNNGTVKIYVDGVNMALTTVHSAATNPDVGNTANFNIAFSNGVGYAHGAIDDARVYDRALTETEVAQLYKFGQVSVTPFTCGVSTVKDADGNVYNTLKIGTQCWMKQNMRVGTLVTAATNQTNNGVIEKHCYDDTLANCMTNNNPNYSDGGLYQWGEAMQYSTTPGARGICPIGWHIPTHDQFTTLERAICTSGSCATDFPYDTSTTGYRGTNEGTKLKANGTSGFEGNLTGYTSGSSWSRGVAGEFWSSFESGGLAWDHTLNSGSAQVGRWKAAYILAFPVRCLKD